MTTEPIIWYAELTTYKCNKSSNWKQTTVKEYIKMISNKNLKASLNEVIHGEFARPYFDIDKISHKLDITSIVQTLKKSFVNCFNCNFKADTLVATITKNTEKDAYHIFFSLPNKPIIVKKKELHEFVKEFSKKIYIECADGKFRLCQIDPQVYGEPTQLFRSVNQPKASNQGIKHSNSHELIEGKIEDTVIQNYITSKSVKLTLVILPC